jgi:hypothetical protein
MEVNSFQLKCKRSIHVDSSRVDCCNDSIGVLIFQMETENLEDWKCDAAGPSEICGLESWNSFCSEQSRTVFDLPLMNWKKAPAETRKRLFGSGFSEKMKCWGWASEKQIGWSRVTSIVNIQ